MARGKAATFEMQRASILKSAADLFADKGYHAAAMSELARACGVSKPLLYHYYRDKDHILFDIADSYMDQLLAIIERVEARGLEPRAHLEALIARFLEEYEHSQSQHSVLVQDVKHLPQELRDRVMDKERQVVATFAAVIVEIEPGLKKRSLDKAVAMILFGMINWTFTWLRADGPLSYADMAPVVTQIFMNGIAGLDQRMSSRRTRSRRNVADAVAEDAPAGTA
ncbi:MAG: TetR/AcrR family transcriptional regulator [Rhodocyclaceae bacterium]|jgi:AcrR family transcriptional regulator|nr:TetR/AcrR family transcriptional regulator [Rhodocyclaceae bacterium]